MEIKLLNKSENKLSFIIKGIDVTLANALRRFMVSETPVLAVDEVVFTKNSSALFDEIVAHRIGLIPLKTDLKSYEIKEKCKCGGKGCAKCTLNFKLNCKGPCTVYTSDLKSQDPEITPVYLNIPIVILLKDQELELEATAVLNVGRVHTKFSPCLAYYRSYPVIKINEDCLKAIDVCPKGVFEEKNKKLVIKNEIACDMCKACEDTCDGKIKISGKDDEFIFTIESWGQLSPKEIFETALDMFDEKLEEFASKLKKA